MMWRRCNIARRAAATMTTLGSLLPLLVLAATPAARGQAADPVEGYPDAAGVIRAYTTVRAWLDEMDVPHPEANEAAVTIERATGVCVMIRRSGHLVGVGTDCGGDEMMVRRAAGRAFGSLWADPRMQALPDELRETIGPTLLLELEVTGPVRPSLAQSTIELNRRLDPGLDAVALRRGERWAILFPARLRAAGLAGRIPQAAPAMAEELGLPAPEISNLLQKRELSAYTCRTMHLVQTEAGATPVETVRGNQLVDAHTVDTAAIIAVADGIARHVIGTRFEPPDVWPPLGFRGDYQVLTDTYAPLVALPLEQGLLSLALLRYASCPQVDRETAQAATRAARAGLLDLARMTEGEIDPLATPASTAAFVLAVTESPELLGDPVLADPQLADMFNRAVDLVTGSFEPALGFTWNRGDNAEPLGMSPHSEAMLAGAMAAVLARDAARVDAERVRAALDHLWTQTPEQHVITLFPWIGWAELSYADAVSAPSPWLNALMLVREGLLRSRIGPGGIDGPRDLDGAFALSGTRVIGGRASLANAHSLRPAAFLATMLREKQLIPPDQAPGALLDHLGSLRFLMQLVIDDSHRWCVPNMRLAAGGVRGSTWDQAQPAAVQATALLVAAETLLSLDALSSR